MTYKICITETLSRVVEIEASSSDEAYDICKEMYRNEEIVLDSNDYLCTDFDEMEDE